jgi:hypothetical protein
LQYPSSRYRNCGGTEKRNRRVYKAVLVTESDICSIPSLFQVDMPIGPLFVADFQRKMMDGEKNFIGRFSKSTYVSNFTKIRPLGAEFHADRQT